uniref:Olfactory receptor n=1 Tax=Laticauda laticaudata TaxID=8630 RepID=A0A8C5WP14_LATLA
MEGYNHTEVTEFIIVGFPHLRHLQTVLFILLLLVYFFTIFGNLVVFMVIRTDGRLHTPMYFFISILSFLEIWYTEKYISFMGCLLQTYFFHSLGDTECYLLTAMAYDRYLAICKPLRYPPMMTTKMCAQMVASCWVCGFMCPITEVILVSKLPFCGPNQIKHIFCDFPPLLSLACTDTTINVLVDFAVNAFIILVTFSFIMVSYAKIIQTVLKIQTAESREKAFSTCASHLTVVFLFFGSILFMYYDRAFAVIYAVLTPLVNPIIYSLRNKEILRRQLDFLCSSLKAFPFSSIN